MNVLMIGVDKTSIGGMLTVVENYINNDYFCKKTNLRYIPTVIRANKFKKIIVFLKAIPKIIITIKKNDIDIVHVHMSERGSVFREGFIVWISNILGCKTIIHMHGADIEDWYNIQNKIIKKIISKIFCLCDRMIVLGENWLPFMKKVMNNNEDKINVLHNAVHVEEKNMINLKAKNILFYGMLIKRKGINDLLNAFAMIKNRIPKDVCLRLYGDNKDFDVEFEIKKCHLEGRVTYEGWMDKEDRNKVFSNILINVLPSYNEGLPMTILESMSYGIPNISTNIAAIPEAINDGINGFLIKPGDIDSLANKLEKLINNNELLYEFSKNAYETIKNEFSIESHVEKLLNIYSKIL